LNSSKEKAKVLKARARALAKEGVRVEEDESHLEVVEFMLAHERYALELTHIREVYPLKELTPLPGTPDFVLGIINVRGQILSIVDIKRFFDLPHKGLTNLNQVIILQSDKMEFGILADEILGTRSIPASDIQTSLPTLTGIRADYLKGVTGDRVVILDGGEILSDENMVVQ
jgi:purine-binding chemotaxis protein CheW